MPARIRRDEAKGYSKGQMAEGVLQVDPIAAQIAASMPRYDPLAPARGAGARRGVFALSLILHLVLLLIFWDMLAAIWAAIGSTC